MSHRRDTAEMLRAPEPAAPTVDDAFFHQLAGLALESVPRARPSRSPRAKVAAAAAGVALLTTGVAVAVDQLAQPEDRAPVGPTDDGNPPVPDRSRDAHPDRRDHRGGEDDRSLHERSPGAGDPSGTPSGRSPRGSTDGGPEDHAASTTDEPATPAVPHLTSGSADDDTSGSAGDDSGSAEDDLGGESGRGEDDPSTEGSGEDGSGDHSAGGSGDDSSG